MKLEVNELYEGVRGYEKFFPAWTRNETEAFLSNIKRGRVKKDGAFYKRDKELYVYYVNKVYENLMHRFAVDVDEIKEERDTVLRMLDALPAEQFKSFITLAFEPYTTLEDNVGITFEG